MAQGNKRGGLAEDTSPSRDDREPIHFYVVMNGAGRVLLPAEVRTALGVGEGDTLSGVVVNGELTLLTPATALRQTQERLAKLVPPGASVVDEFIAERHAENAREEEEVRQLLAKRAEP